MSPGAAWPGAEVSRCDVPHHRVGQRLIGHQPLQPTVLALQCFQPLGLVDPQPPVLPPPAVIRWLGHAEAARDLRDRFPLREHHLRLPQFADDLLGRVPLACHADSLRTGPNPRTGSGPVLGGQVRKAYETLHSESGLSDALTKFLEHAQFAETLKIAEPVPYATPQRLDSALTEAPGAVRQYVQGVIDMKPTAQAQIYELVGRLADMGDAGQWARMVTAYETLIGHRPELTDLWLVPNDAVSGFNSYVPGDPIPDISAPLRELAPDESIYYLNPLPFSPLQ